MVSKHIGENDDFVMGTGGSVTGDNPAEASTTNLNSI
jgi:hypothetical protein